MPLKTIIFTCINGVAKSKNISNNPEFTAE